MIYVSLPEEEPGLLSMTSEAGYAWYLKPSEASKLAKDLNAAVDRSKAKAAKGVVK